MGFNQSLLLVKMISWTNAIHHLAIVDSTVNQNIFRLKVISRANKSQNFNKWKIGAQSNYLATSTSTSVCPLCPFRLSTLGECPNTNFSFCSSIIILMSLIKISWHVLRTKNMYSGSSLDPWGPWCKAKPGSVHYNIGQGEAILTSTINYYSTELMEVRLIWQS